MYFSRWKIYAVIGICLLGMLLAVPNLMSRDLLAKLPGIVPHRQVNLGLDLRGGSRLLLQLDLSALDLLLNCGREAAAVLEGASPASSH